MSQSFHFIIYHIVYKNIFKSGYSDAIYGHTNRDCYKYNVTADKWIKFATSAYDHQENPGIIYQNKLYIFDTTNANPEVYDLVKNTWARCQFLQQVLLATVLKKLDCFTNKAFVVYL